MNPLTHEVAKRIVDHAMTGQTTLAGKGWRNNQQTIVSTAAFGTLMTGVARRIVDQLDAIRRQHGEALMDQCLAVALDVVDGGERRFAHAGKTFLNGLTVTDW